MTESGKILVQETLQRGRLQGKRMLLGAAGRGFGFGLALSAILIVAGAFLNLPAGVRAAAFLLVLSIALGPFVTALIRIVPSMFDAEESARATERESADMHERLVPAVQILRARDDSKTGYSHDLVDAFIDDVLSRLRSIDVGTLPSHAFARRGLLIAGAGVVVLAAVLAVLGVERSGGAARRYASAFMELGPKAPVQFAVEPGNAVIARGTAIALAARVSGTPAPGILETRGDPKSPWKETTLPASERYEHRIAKVDESFEYRFGQGRDRSETYRVDAIAPTTVSVEEIRYRYPEYTGLAPASITDGGGDLSAVKGTKAEVFFRPSNAPRRAALLREKDPPLNLEGADAGLYRAELSILQEDTYRVEIEDQTGTVNSDPITHRIQPLTDEAPFIRLLEPGEDRDLDESLKATLRYSAIDDYGLGPVVLRFESSRAPGQEHQVKIFTPKGRSPEISQSYEWTLSDLDLLPGDAVTYFLEVSDRNSVDGPSTSRTRSFVLRFPSLGEIYSEIEEGQKTSIDDMKEVAGEIKKVEEKVEQIGREMLKKGEASWENKQEMQRALETQQKLSTELQRIQESVDRNMQSLLQSEFMSFEALQKMEQLQKLLDEVTNEEMKKALDKLREALEQNDGRKEQEIADFQKAQEELMKNLDRVIENLKQFRMEEKLKAAVRRLEELAARQERVNEDLQMPDQAGEKAQEKDAKENADDKKALDEKNGAETDDDSSADSNEKQNEDEAKKESSQKDAEAQEKKGSEKSGEESAQEDSEKKSDKENERLAEQEKALSEETKKLEKEIEDLANMVKELRDAHEQEGMDQVSKEMKQKEIPKTMGEMSQNMEKSESDKAEEQGEKALTELRETLTALTQQQQSMSAHQITINQAAINRAVRDLLSLSEDEESLAGNLEEIPRNTVSATRGFADEQRRLIQGAERVDKMLEEVAKGTPIMESAIGKTLEHGVESMRESAYGLESGAVQAANQEGEKAVDDLNAVVIQLLRAAQSMSSCPSGNPMSGAMQQLQQLSKDQEKLNQMMQQLREEMKSSPSHRLQGHMQSLADEQARIQKELQKIMNEIGEGGGLLGSLDDVSQKLDDVAQRMKQGDLGDQVVKDQQWALTRLLDSQRSIRERDFGKERRSKTGEELGQLTPPSELPGGIDDPMRDLREDLLKALDRRYPPKYEELIKRYFRSLSREENTTPTPPPDLP